MVSLSNQEAIVSYPTTYVAPGGGDELYSGDATVTVKCRAAQTGGGYELFEIDMARGAVVPPHREPWAKAFYVLTGRMRVRSGDETYELGPGAFVTVPPGSANTFEVLSPAVKFLAISLGAGLGDFFADVDRHAAPGMTIEELLPVIAEIPARHGVQFIDESAVA